MTDEFARFAAELADSARQVTVPAAAARIAVENKKGDGFDPVTAADRDAELAMRRAIEARYPEHGINGEEFGSVRSGSRFVWSLDPIDGTRSFICGLPTWTTLIALLADGEPLVGLIDVPILGERYLGHAGSGVVLTRRGEHKLATSGCRALEEARLSTTDPFLFGAEEAEGFERLRRTARVTRYGHDAYGYARLAAGGIDLVVESGLQPHDIHALVPVVRAAGGTIGGWDAGEGFASGRVLAAATEDLFEQASAMLSRS